MLFSVPQRPHHDQQIHRYPRQHQLPSRQINQPAQNHPLQRIMQGITGSDASVGTIATKGVNGLSKTLKNVQQVLHVVQSATPIVQEYGPMVKNIPAMYRMIKSFQDIEDAPEDKEQINSNNVENPGNTKIPTADSGRKPEADSRGQSTPKLFI
ncbi:MAG TPA: VrrA/YqfQ family protein [Virgibacillus sp.]|nr:VrrA/YqfQ family protein [Virgibacillus sp.]